MTYLYNDQKLKTRRRDLRNNMPAPEQKLWFYLKCKNLKSYKFRRQFGIGHFIVDFFCPKLKLVIEIDGDSHFLTSETMQRDKGREEFLIKRQIKIMRFTNDEVIKNIEGVIQKILTYLP